MPITYSLLAADCPAIQMPTALLDPTVESGPQAKRISSGDAPTSMLPNLNYNAGLVEGASRYGGGLAFSVCAGLDFSAGDGLNLTVAAGSAMIDGLRTIAESVVEITESAERTYLWMTGNGALVPITGPDKEPPSTPAVFLGSVLTENGEITQIDGSGVLHFRGGQLWRRTADANRPTDEPPVGLQFRNYTENGIRWEWDGLGYYGHGVSVIQEADVTIEDGAVVLDFHPDDFDTWADPPGEANVRLSQAGLHSPMVPIRDVIAQGVSVEVRTSEQLTVFAPFVVEGTVTVNGRLRVLR